MKPTLTFILFLLTIILNAQTIVTTVPQFPSETDNITITFNTTNCNPQGKSPLINYNSGTAYAYTGVTLSIDNGAPQRWQNITANWGTNLAQYAMTNLGSNRFQIVINNPMTYYNVNPTAGHTIKITELCFVIRSADGSKQTEDIFVPIYSPGISVKLISPVISTSYGDPLRSPLFISPGATVPVIAVASQIGTKVKSITLFVNGIQKAQTLTDSLNFTFNSNNYAGSKNIVKIVAADIANNKDSTQFAIMKSQVMQNLPLPAGNQIGINYGSDPTTVTLALYAPYKNFIYVIGDFNDWKVDSSYYMNRYEPKPDSVIWWITLKGLTPGQEYGYQFLIDGNLRIYDPYTEKVLDPVYDPAIPASIYPNLKPYPTQETSNLVSVLQTGQYPYNWKVTQFTRPPKESLVIYELLVRDFVSTHWYQTIMDTLSYLKKLSVNAIELMPVSEFEGNDSWGYNPATYFAPDKYYGTKQDLQALIDACHQNGIAVIMDIVLNHAYNSNSMAQMYWDNVNNRPAANNPWFNQVSPNTSYSYGNDFNHASLATKYFVDRVTSFWLTNYKFDGFRFDFAKGFTNTPGEGTPYDASRIAILERIASKIWGVSSDAYVILELFTANSEEIELSNYGMMIWGNLNSNYSQATSGYGNGWDFSPVSYLNLGWSSPKLIGYMESHDEERLMYNNITNGNHNLAGSYNIKSLTTALARVREAAAFFITVPGPKMIWEFGELGYDYSINYPSGSSSDRTTAKPIRWDYENDPNRKYLFNTFAVLIQLKKTYPAFSSSSFSVIAANYIKFISINHSSMNVYIVGNFDVNPQIATGAFQSTGKWYEFFSSDSITVTDTQMQINLQPGEYRLYTSVRIPGSGIPTSVNENNSIPQDYKLDQNYPNPFNPSTTINYQLTSLSNVKIKIFDILGREVVTLVNTQKPAGKYKVIWNGTDNSGNKVTSGIYFYTIQTGNFTASKKMVLLK
jgi:pullulanase/glycogen debranching enzyme